MKFCFIGGGNMATALIGGLYASNFEGFSLSVVEINPDNRALFHKKYGESIHTTDNLAEGVADSDIVVFAVKPQQLREVCAHLAPLLKGQLLLSIAAGIRSSDIARWVGTENIVRAMPNTPALVQCGATGLFALPQVSPAHKEVATKILGAVGSTVWVQEESLLDGVTAISGSGPAYVFYFIEAMQQAARELGLDEAQARSLVIDTFLGAAKLAQASADEVSVLRARVTSKNGTTERALLSMEADAVKQHIIAAAHAAAKRSKEMGDELGCAS